jgi:hypothetical protein
MEVEGFPPALYPGEKDKKFRGKFHTQSGAKNTLKNNLLLNLI